LIRAICGKELMELWRSGVARGVLVLIVALIFVSLVSGWAALRDRQAQVEDAQRSDETVFTAQGNKNPHSAAHFGRMAYKPVSALSLFDPGAALYLGQVVWLEAHRQSPAMFRPAEDSPELRRLADLSVAGVLTLLLPLVIILAGHGTFAAERERGTLRLLLTAGPGMLSLFVGKLAALAGSGALVSAVAIIVSAALALFMADSSAAGDIVIRASVLVVAYGLYCLAIAGVVLLVSARSDSAASALGILLSLWAVCIVVTPRVAAGIAGQAHPTPQSGVFWSEASNTIANARPSRTSAELKELERLVISRALKERGEKTLSPVDRRGVQLEIMEILGSRAYAKSYNSLYATYDRQRRLRRALSIFSPAIALSHISGALAGTDTTAHRDFVQQAEQQRNLVIRRINEDLLLKGANRADYVSGRDLWEAIPRFVYRPATAREAIVSAAGDLVAMALWTGTMLIVAAFGASRQRIS
jgi:ABC-2 type transport system permease protein